MLKSESPKFQRITFVGLGDKRQGEILFTTDNEDVVIGDRQLQAKLDTRSCLHVTARDSHDTWPRRIKSKGTTFKQKWKIFENEKARSGVEKYFVGKLTSMKQDQKQATDPCSFHWTNIKWLMIDDWYWYLNYARLYLIKKVWGLIFVKNLNRCFCALFTWLQN